MNSQLAAVQGCGVQPRVFWQWMEERKGESCCILIQTSLLLLNLVCKREGRTVLPTSAALDGSRVSVQSCLLSSPYTTQERTCHCVGHPPVLARAGKAASQGAQSGSKLLQGAVSGWRV